LGSTAIANAGAPPTPSRASGLRLTPILLGSPTTIGDHIVETGSGQRVAVTWINPIKYDLPELIDTYTTIPSTISLNSPAGFLPTGSLSGADYGSLKCDTSVNCDRAIKRLAGDHTNFQNSFNARYYYALNALGILTNASSAYDYMISSYAGANNWTEPSLDNSVIACVGEIANYAQWLNPGSDSVKSVPISSDKGSVCPNAPALSGTVLPVRIAVRSNE
jgi:hypothetical protein